MGNMFYGCISLVSLNISNFKTYSVTNMENMFYNCYSLISLVIDKFDVSSIDTNYDNIFFNCKSLISLNLTNFYSFSESTSRLFSNLNSHFTYCIDNEKNYNFLSELQNYHNNCSDLYIRFNSKKYIV